MKLQLPYLNYNQKRPFSLIFLTKNTTKCPVSPVHAQNKLAVQLVAEITKFLGIGFSRLNPSLTFSPPCQNSSNILFNI
jgi:hypothetical protein